MCGILLNCLEQEENYSSTRHRDVALYKRQRYREERTGFFSCGDILITKLIQFINDNIMA
jgi:hypothetical protein